MFFKSKSKSDEVKFLREEIRSGRWRRLTVARDSVVETILSFPNDVDTMALRVEIVAKIQMVDFVHLVSPNKDTVGLELKLSKGSVFVHINVVTGDILAIHPIQDKWRITVEENIWED